MTKVLVTASFAEHLLDKIHAVSPDIRLEVQQLPEGEWMDGHETDAEILYTAQGVPRPDQVPRLKWMQTHWAGVDHLKELPIWDSDLLITNSSGIHAPNIAQYVMAQILAWSYRVPRWLDYQRRGEWPEKRWEKFVPDELQGQTLGIAGYGSIGREVARLARCFGMRVLATKRNVHQVEDEEYQLDALGDPAGELVEQIYPGEKTDRMVAECDYVVITLPLTEQTHYLFDAGMFRAMKPTAFLVNIGRGSIVKEEDLVCALREGWIAGAGLDVFEQEPLPQESPLWKLDNVILSPHVSGFTTAYDERAVDLFVKNLDRYLQGKHLLNLVDREAGY